MSIWTRSPHQQFTLKVGGPALNEAQFAGPWEAYSVVVANRTTQHLRLPDINYWAPPGIIGLTMPLPGLMQATASFSPPPLIADPPATAGQIATLDFFAEELPPHPGVTMPLLPGKQQVSGTLKALGDTVTIPCGGSAYVAFLLNGTIDVGNYVSFLGSIDGINGFGIPCLQGNYWNLSGQPTVAGGNQFIIATQSFVQVSVSLSNLANSTGISVLATALPGTALPNIPFTTVSAPAGMPTLANTYAANATADILVPSGIAGAPQRPVVFALTGVLETTASGLQQVDFVDQHGLYVARYRMNTQAPVPVNVNLPSGMPLTIGDHFRMVVGAGTPSVDVGVVAYTVLL